jgi:hypothetical protein
VTASMSAPFDDDDDDDDGDDDDDDDDDFVSGVLRCWLTLEPVLVQHAAIYVSIVIVATLHSVHHLSIVVLLMIRRCVVLFSRSAAQVPKLWVHRH